MAVRRQDWEPVLEALKKMRAKWPTRGWSWDSRFTCAASSFSGDYEEEARDAIALAMPTMWLPATLGQASAPLRDLAESTGGLRAGQMLFSGGSPTHPTTGVAALVCYGLWWPWRDQRMVSLRVGFCGLSEMSDPYPQFRDAFGITF
jgi:hypothetical protein